VRTTIPVIVAFVTGVVMVIAFFFNEETTVVGGLTNELLNWIIIIGGFSLLLGMVSLFRVNLNAIQRRSKDWGYKILTIIAALAMAIPSVMPDSWSPLFGRDVGTSLYDWLFAKLQMPMMATMFATLAFYIASAAYRAFRARTAEATLLLITATAVMMWRVPMGEAILNLLPGDIPWFLNTYVMNGVNLAVQRGIIIGAALGAAAMSLRIILGIERTYMGKG
jgi:hypothetical protein